MMERLCYDRRTGMNAATFSDTYCIEGKTGCCVLLSRKPLFISVNHICKYYVIFWHTILVSRLKCFSTGGPG